MNDYRYCSVIDTGNSSFVTYSYSARRIEIVLDLSSKIDVNVILSVPCYHTDRSISIWTGRYISLGRYSNSPYIDITTAAHVLNARCLLQQVGFKPLFCKNPGNNTYCASICVFHYTYVGNIITPAKNDFFSSISIGMST